MLDWLHTHNQVGLFDHLSDKPGSSMLRQVHSEFSRAMAYLLRGKAPVFRLESGREEYTFVPQGIDRIQVFGRERTPAHIPLANETNDCRLPYLFSAQERCSRLFVHPEIETIELVQK